jgi:glutamyl-tRNA reductase
MPQDSSKPGILLLGVNHKTAEVGIRERLAMVNSDIPPLQFFSSLNVCDEVVFLSTCNRVEVIAVAPSIENAMAKIKLHWLEKSGLSLKDASNLYEHKADDAIRHLFRVASSLDSMVVGEPQILGQLKDAYKKADEAKTTGTILNRLMHKAFSVAKTIRTETRIASNAVSISYAAVELAKKIFGELKGKRAMLIGAGEMAELAAQHLMANGVSKLIVANRTLARAVELADKLHGKAVSLDEIPDALHEVDIVISSTGAPGYVITAEQVKKAMRPRKHNLLFLIDIAVPRDIEPNVNNIENVYLYDIDDLSGIVETNKAEREKEALKAERIVEAEVIKFISWLKCLDIVPLIQGIQNKAEETRLKELSRSQSALKGLTPEQLKAIDTLTRSLVQKLLHDPIVSLRKSHSEGEEQALALMDAASHLFKVNGSGK